MKVTGHQDQICAAGVVARSRRLKLLLFQYYLLVQYPLIIKYMAKQKSRTLHSTIHGCDKQGGERNRYKYSLTRVK